jgi:hypothetical protein
MANRLALVRLGRHEFDFTDLDNLTRATEPAIRRAKAVLDRFASPPRGLHDRVQGRLELIRI